MTNDNKLFSERRGYTQPKFPQREEMDNDLRTGLWNAFYQSFPESFTGDSIFGYRILPEIYREVFVSFLKYNADEYCGKDTYTSGLEYSMDQKMDDTIYAIKNFFLDGKWYEVYDLIEFVMESSNDEAYRNLCSITLEKENSAYKIVDKFITDITSEQELAEIETALKIPYAPAKEHLRKALTLLSDRKNPDYENSIKESISAVESIAKEITGKEKSLNALTQTLKLPPGLKTALDEFYNWASKYGIRHAKSRKSLSLDQATARFMLVTCSAFVNYIIAKNSE